MQTCTCLRWKNKTVGRTYKDWKGKQIILVTCLMTDDKWLWLWLASRSIEEDIVSDCRVLFIFGRHTDKQAYKNPLGWTNYIWPTLLQK